MRDGHNVRLSDLFLNECVGIFSELIQLSSLLSKFFVILLSSFGMCLGAYFSEIQGVSRRITTVKSFLEYSCQYFVKL